MVQTHQSTANRPGDRILGPLGNWGVRAPKSRYTPSLNLYQNCELAGYFITKTYLIISFFCRRNVHCHASVSYTHLDVYKRQSLCCHPGMGNGRVWKCLLEGVIILNVAVCRCLTVAGLTLVGKSLREQWSWTPNVESAEAIQIWKSLLACPTVQRGCTF